MAPPSAPQPRAPWLFRSAVWFFTCVFGLLLFWLSGFVIRDIDSLRGPDYGEIEKEYVPESLNTRRDDLQKQIEETNRQLQQRRTRQQLLSDSSRGLQDTMSQLLELQKLSIEKNVSLSDEQTASFRQSLDAFLQNQTRYQALNEELTTLTDQLEQRQAQLRTVETEIGEARKPAVQAFEDQLRRHRLRLAGFKLAVLVPLLLAGAWLLLRQRGHRFFPFALAFAAAVAFRVTLVLHAHFPMRYFKYLLIGVFLLVVGRLLAWLINAIRSPKPERLLRQYREAYERFLCPVCEFPIRRGPLRYLYWDRRSVRKLAARMPASPAGEIPEPAGYRCPSCGTGLFEECPSCHGARASLLPFCEHCGAPGGLPAAREA